MTFFVKDGLPGILSIPGNRINIELLRNKSDYDIILNLHVKNLKDNYIKSLFQENVADVTIETITRDLWSRFSTNLLCRWDEKRFYQLFFIIRLNSGEIIGAIDVYGSWAIAGLGIFISAEYSNQKYGTEAIMTIIQYLKENTDIIKLKWECDYDNMSSLKIAKKCGFTFSHNFEIRTENVGSTFYLDQ